jgi:hypothetical protein
MLSYQTALKLKEAGYPQDYTNAPIGEPVSDYVYSPTLEELIEACGERFDSLHKAKIDGHEYWQATSTNGIFTGWHTKSSEAVAGLWLALNT